jgi:hypothetical protein
MFFGSILVSRIAIAQWYFFWQTQLHSPPWKEDTLDFLYLYFQKKGLGLWSPTKNIFLLYFRLRNVLIQLRRVKLVWRLI